MADVVDTIYIIVNNADTLQKMEQDEMHTYEKMHHAYKLICFRL